MLTFDKSTARVMATLIFEELHSEWGDYDPTEDPEDYAVLQEELAALAECIEGESLQHCNIWHTINNAEYRIMGDTVSA